MATLHEYYEKDFSHSTKMHIKMLLEDTIVQGMVLYDFAGFSGFLALYVSETNRDLNFFVDLLSNLQWGKTTFELDGRVTLPSTFHGRLRIENKPDFEILAQFFGETEWISPKNIQSSKRIFIYSETNLTPEEITYLKSKARELDQDLQFRDQKFTEERSRREKPLAFISYDWRDQDLIAKKIALGLQKMLCPVWYDEFSLKVGDNLRESVEKGLKECKKCILVLSPNFISNNGWTKTEFNSIFTRQILEEQKLILPVWYKISKQDVYNYSPSLLNTLALDWEKLGEEMVCNKLYRSIMD